MDGKNLIDPINLLFIDSISNAIDESFATLSEYLKKPDTKSFRSSI
jgi:hypothetical protein